MMKKVMLGAAAAATVVLGVIGVSSAGLQHDDWGCVRDGHGNTVCHGTVALFAASREPGDWVEFQTLSLPSSGSPMVVFNAQVGDDSYSCGFNLATATEHEKRVWLMAVQHTGYFSISLNGPVCQTLRLATRSSYL
jgi:hypothetical protein